MTYRFRAEKNPLVWCATHEQPIPRDRASSVLTTLFHTEGETVYSYAKCDGYCKETQPEDSENATDTSQEPV